MGCVGSVEARNDAARDVNFQMPDYDKLAADLKAAREKEALLSKSREAESSLHSKVKVATSAKDVTTFVSDDEDSFITVEEVHQAALELQQLEADRSDREDEVDGTRNVNDTSQMQDNSIKDRVSYFTQDSSVPSSPVMSETQAAPEVPQMGSELQKKMAKLQKAKKKSAKKAKKEEFHMERKPFQSEEVTSSRRRGPTYAAIVSDSKVMEQMC